MRNDFYRGAACLAGLVAGAAFVPVASACGGGNSASQFATPPTYAPADQTKCGVEKSRAKPLIVEWPSADRGELEAQAHNRGLVVVRYQGCEMKVLDGCTTSVKYGYAPITRKKDRVVIRDTDDLYANVPVGAAKLEAKLQKSGELDVDITMVGRWEATRQNLRSDELQGSCEGATHVVSALTVGAFTFTAGANASLGGGATVLGAGATAQSTSKRETLNSDGEETACEKATSADTTPPDGCGALLRVEVVPLVRDAAPTPGAGPVDRAEAVRTKCQEGDGKACCTYGSALQTGMLIMPSRTPLRIAPDPATAGIYWKKACDQGYGACCTTAAGALAQGSNGLPKDSKLAVAMMEAACEHGDASACSGLGVWVEMGTAVGLKPDPRRARALYDRACKAGDLLGCNQLQHLPAHY